MVPVFLALSLAAPGSDSIRVSDAFDRDVTERGIVLVDWEGPIANPAIWIYVHVPPETPIPAELYVTGSDIRLHFNRADAQDRSGVGKRVTIRETERPVPVRVAIFPDDDGEDEVHHLLLQVFAGGQEHARLELPVRVLDQDRPDRPLAYPIHLDYSEDATGYFAREDVRRVIQRAADSWAYFLADPEYDPVPAGEEQVHLWGPDGFRVRRRHTIEHEYRGFYLFVSGIQHDEMRAGGAPSLIGGWQTRGGEPLPLRRSGSIEFDIRGNWNQMGWWLDARPEQWWVSGNLRFEPNDLYSIALHEMGHAFAFHRAYPVWGEARQENVWRASEVVAYLGSEVTLNPSDHTVGTVDPVSGYGAFGSEYQASMKARRWLITKLDLIALRVIGYRLRPTSAFESLRTEQERWEWEAHTHRMFAVTIPAAGGVPTYRFRVTAGRLPEGLTLDSFTGEITGRPMESGTFEAWVEIVDQDPTTVPLEVSVLVRVRNDL